MFGVLVSLLSLGVVILVHELGHMLSARRAGIGVIEFSIGMGPRAWSVKRGETRYSVRWLPFGGFVKLAGMDDEEENAAAFPESRYYQKSSIWARLMTIAAGSVVNITFGFVLFFLMFFLIGSPVIDSKINSVLPGSPAEKAGLQMGDQLMMVNNIPVKNAETDIIKRIHSSGGKPVTLHVKRNSSDLNMTITPVHPASDASIYIIGVTMGQVMQRNDFVTAIRSTVNETIFSIKIVFTSFYMLVTHEANIKDLLGPVGIIQLTSSSVDKGFYVFIRLLGLISINLGVVNLLPIPVLDGGHIMFLALEAIRRKPFNKHIESAINNVGAAFLIALMLFIVFNDLANWKSRILMFQ